MNFMELRKHQRHNWFWVFIDRTGTKKTYLVCDDFGNLVAVGGQSRRTMED